MIQILDNRKEQYDLEIDNEGFGKWYIYNTDNNKIISCKYKSEAIEIKRNPNDWDI